MKLTAPQIAQLFHGLLSGRIAGGTDGQGDQDLVGVQTGIAVTQMVHLQVLDGVNDLRGDQVQLVIQTGQCLQRIQ